MQSPLGLGRSEVAIAFKGKTYVWSIRVSSIRCRSITHRFVCMYTTGASRVLSQDCRQDCITLLSVIELIESSNQIKIKSGNDRIVYSGIMRGPYGRGSGTGKQIIFHVHKDFMQVKFITNFLGFEPESPWLSLVLVHTALQHLLVQSIIVFV